MKNLQCALALACGFLLAMVALGTPLQAGINVWTSQGPFGGTIRALAIDPVTPSTLYAGTIHPNVPNGGVVFKSTNGGTTWTATGGSFSEFFGALAIDPVTPSTLYAGTLGGVFKSTNGGTTWTAINTGLTSTSVLALAIDTATPSTLYAGTAGGGVFDITFSLLAITLTPFNPPIQIPAAGLNTGLV